MDGGDAEAEELLRAAGNVLGSTIPMDAECAEAIGELTGCTDVLGDYDDALPRRVSLVRLMALPGAKHQGEHATQSPSYPSVPFTSGIFASPMVAAVPAVLGAYFRCRLFGLVGKVAIACGLAALVLERLPLRVTS
jgi:hypothetical protein